MPRPWVPYIVQQGDHVDRLAFRFGTTADGLWSNGENADLAAKRKNRGTLYPGDVLHVPSEPAAALDVHAHVKNGFTAVVPKVPVKLRVLSHQLPVEGKAFQVDGAGGSSPIEGTVGSDGRVAFEVPVWARELTLRIPEAEVVLRLHVGDLDPIDERSGAVQRLHNLGYLLRSEGVRDDQLALATKSFQHKHGLDETGVLDEATLAELAKACAR